MESGVAQKPIKNFEKYKLKLASFQGRRRGFIREIINKVKRKNKSRSWDLPRIVFPEGNSKRTLKAINMLYEEKLMCPMLLGDPEEIRQLIQEMELDNMDGVEIINPGQSTQFASYVKTFYEMKQRKGILKKEAAQLMKDPNYFGAMMLELNAVDAVITGATQNYVDSIRPILQIIGTGKRKIASGMNIVLVQDQILFFADTTVNINPSAVDIANIAVHTTRVAYGLNVKPRIAMLSFSNFTGRQENPKKMKEATQLIKKWYPDWVVDGEMQADTAVNPNIVKNIFPFCQIQQGANVLIFPNLDSGNIAYKLVQQLGSGEVLGPFLMGVKKPVNIVQRTGTTEDVANTIVMTCLKVQAYKEFAEKEKNSK
ncbi:MAG: phosphate acyltransferase [Bdellovibrionales bacterium]|nr:phosphate acyltransferase [Bdellovibrionales bacterium]